MGSIYHEYTPIVGCLTNRMSVSPRPFGGRSHSGGGELVKIS